MIYLFIFFLYFTWPLANEFCLQLQETQLKTASDQSPRLAKAIPNQCPVNGIGDPTF